MLEQYAEMCLQHLTVSFDVCSVYARAFREGFTVTLVSGRTVGIGAYLARLGRRYCLPPAQSSLNCAAPT